MEKERRPKDFEAACQGLWDRFLVMSLPDPRFDLAKFNYLAHARRWIPLSIPI